MNNCKLEGCGRNAYCAGYCATHYRRSLKGADMNAPIMTMEQAGRLGGLVSPRNKNKEGK